MRDTDPTIDARPASEAVLRAYLVALRDVETTLAVAFGLCPWEVPEALIEIEETLGDEMSRVDALVNHREAA